jgi:S1-C subfamily serine protease
LEHDKAVLVAGVEAASPAAAADLRPGDLIVALDGKPLYGVDGLLRALDGESVGKRLTVVVLRETKRIERTLVPVAEPED